MADNQESSGCEESNKTQPVTHQAVKNRKEGAAFEKVFKERALSNWLYVKKTDLQARRVKKGRVQILKSDLDFKLINRLGDVGFFDCKCFNAGGFVYSNINPRQLEFAVQYNEWSVPAGFVIYFKANCAVVYFSGIQIQKAGPRSKFTWKDGIYLGNLFDFDLRKLLSTNRERTTK